MFQSRTVHKILYKSSTKSAVAIHYFVACYVCVNDPSVT